MFQPRLERVSEEEEKKRERKRGRERGCEGVKVGIVRRWPNYFSWLNEEKGERRGRGVLRSLLELFGPQMGPQIRRCFYGVLLDLRISLEGMEFNLTRECFSWMVFGEAPGGSYNAEILWGKNIRFVHSEKEEEGGREVVEHGSFELHVMLRVIIGNDYLVQFGHVCLCRYAR